MAKQVRTEANSGSEKKQIRIISLKQPIERKAVPLKGSVLKKTAEGTTRVSKRLKVKFDIAKIEHAVFEFEPSEDWRVECKGACKRLKDLQAKSTQQKIARARNGIPPSTSGAVRYHEVCGVE